MKKFLAYASLFGCLFILVAIDSCRQKMARPVTTDNQQLDSNTSADRIRKLPSQPLPLPETRKPDSKLPPVVPVKRP